MGAHVLVVDDEPLTRDALKAHLEQEGFAVDVAADGEEGLGMILAGAYDAVITDLVMPGMSGEEMLRKALAEKGATRALIICAGDSSTSALGGSVRVLQKPFAMPEMAAALRAVLEGPTR
jgi:DNA-binding response OmpR family regulator